MIHKVLGIHHYPNQSNSKKRGGFAKDVHESGTVPALSPWVGCSSNRYTEER